MLTSLLNRLRAGDTSGLAGTDLLIRLPLRQRLINVVLAEQTPPPVRELRMEMLADNHLRLYLEVEAPIVGRTSRELTLRIRGELRPGHQDILDFDILSGLQFFDKPIIQLARGIIAEKLPAGVELSSKRLRIHFSQLVTALGHAYALPLLHAVRLESHPNQLQVLLHVQAAE